MSLFRFQMLFVPSDISKLLSAVQFPSQSFTAYVKANYRDLTCTVSFSSIPLKTEAFSSPHLAEVSAQHI